MGQVQREIILISHEEAGGNYFVLFKHFFPCQVKTGFHLELSTASYYRKLCVLLSHRTNLCSHSKTCKCDV